MADNKVPSTSGEETKKTEPVSDNATQTNSGSDKKTEDLQTNSDSADLESRPAKQLQSHFRGMPKQWEKNRVPKKDT
ncbi:hypothetical protein F4819DRAFT_488725 [Hypoxylon fuscum]|nr:hypothetical protein F4819DRAFT_488725 [Hypoxylon fuscum]